ncbi:MAG: hypothetical protein KGL59_04835 [Acidobacteriota bacterium]|nr:hypothetical protein [Acidobacteriota bacterium]
MKYVLAAFLALLGLVATGMAQSQPCGRPDPELKCYEGSQPVPCGPVKCQPPKPHCPAGYKYAGDVKDKKTGQITGVHCVKDVSAIAPLRFPQQQQGIPIGNAPKPSESAGDETLWIPPGSVAHSSSTDDLLNPTLTKYKHPNCEALVDYRDHELGREFQVALTKRNLYLAQKADDLSQASDLLKLMDKEWYGGKTLVQVAIQVRYATDTIKAFFKLLGGESPAMEAIEDVDVTISIARKWKDEGAEKAAEEASKEAVRQMEEEEDPLLAFVHATEDYAENQQSLDKSEEEVQNQVGRLVQSARNWHAKELDAATQARYIDQLKKKITDYCVAQPDIPIPKP